MNEKKFAFLFFENENGVTKYKNKKMKKIKKPKNKKWKKI